MALKKLRKLVMSSNKRFTLRRQQIWGYLSSYTKIALMKKERRKLDKLFSFNYDLIFRIH